VLGPLSRTPGKSNVIVPGTGLKVSFFLFCFFESTLVPIIGPHRRAGVAGAASTTIWGAPLHASPGLVIRRAKGAHPRVLCCRFGRAGGCAAQGRCDRRRPNGKSSGAHGGAAQIQIVGSCVARSSSGGPLRYALSFDAQRSIAFCGVGLLKCLPRKNIGFESNASQTARARSGRGPKISLRQLRARSSVASSKKIRHGTAAHGPQTEIFMLTAAL